MIKSDRAATNFTEMLEVVKSHLANLPVKSVPKQFKLAPILYDKYMECSPEYYLDEIPLTNDMILDSMEDVLNNLISFKINVK